MQQQLANVRANPEILKKNFNMSSGGAIGREEFAFLPEDLAPAPVAPPPQLRPEFSCTFQHIFESKTVGLDD